jgi:uncharacterized protein (DUF4415 family)
MKKPQKMHNDPELLALAQLRDEDIDTSEIVEKTDWSKAVQGRFYRPVKEPVTIRLDLDVVTWLKSDGPGYQTRINSMLRQCMVGAVTPKNAVHSRRVNSGSHFPVLEKHGELGRYSELALLIQRRGSVFAPAA